MIRRDVIFVWSRPPTTPPRRFGLQDLIVWQAGIIVLVLMAAFCAGACKGLFDAVDGRPAKQAPADREGPPAKKAQPAREQPPPAPTTAKE